MPPAASTARELQGKLDGLSKRLEEELSQRVRKRVHAALGAVKKQLAVAETAAAESTAASAAERQEVRAAKRQKKKQQRDHPADASETVPAAPKAMNRIERKGLLLALNRKLAMCAKRKKLKRARELFEEARESGLAPDTHSWTNLVNCLARCGRPDEATAAVAAMRAAGAAPNVVTYTALVKGLCAAGDVGGAAAAVRAAEAEATESTRPNARMGSSLLRGCVRVGAVHLGRRTLEDLWTRWECVPDGAALEAVATLLGQALRPKAIASLLARAETEQVALTPAARGAIHLASARALALIGQRKAAKRQCDALRTALETPDAPIEAREGAAHIDAAAVEEFARHRRAELHLDCDAIRSFLDDSADLDVLGALTKRVLSFVRAPEPPPDAEGAEGADGADGADGEALDGGGDGDGCGGETPSGAWLARNLWEAFGVGGASRRSGIPRADVEEALACRLDARGRLHKLRARKGQRVVVEVCAGSGEWVCAQAAAAPESLFIAIELRVDRGYNIFARTLLQGVPNVLVVVGDAREIVGKRLRAASVSCVCINHPEPPEWAGGGDDSDGAHLLDEPFLRDCRALLEPEGTLAIVTDNRRYGRTVADSLGAIGGLVNLAQPAEGAVDAAVSSTAATDEVEATPPPAVLPGLPPPSCGYAVRDASSFFDRLWANGKKTKRYHLAVVREEEGA